MDTPETEFLYRSLAREIERGIRAGEYAARSRLPSIRMLESIHGVARNTVQGALRVLSRDGLIVRGSSPRQGYRVADLLESVGEEPGESSLNAVKLLLPFSSWQFAGAKYLEAVESVFSRHHCGTLFANHRNALEEERRLLSQVLSVQGGERALILIAAASYDNPNRDLLHQIAPNMPIILLERTIAGFSTHFVGMDNRSIGLRATRHLTATGRRRIAYISGFSRVSPTHERFEGYRDGLAEAGLECDPDLVLMRESLFETLESTRGAGQLFGEELLRAPRRPDAVVCGSDKEAAGLIEYLESTGLRVPRDVAIVGCDHDPLTWRTSEREITTFEYPYADLAEEVYTLYRRVTGKPDLARRTIELEARFVPGESS